METLGKPIGQQHTVPSAGFDQGEHGAGVGLAGGHGQVNSHNTQAGMAAAQQGGIPTGHPIADKFTSQGQGQNSVAGAYAGGATDDGLTGQSNAHRTGAGVGYDGENLPTSRASAAAGAGGGSYATSGDAVSGAYEGGAVRDALTGESHAHSTGAGVGPLGENLGQSHQGHHHGHHGHHHATDAALAGTAAGAVAGAGAAAGTGVGPSGGAGGHYNVPSTTSTSTGTGNASGVGAGGLATGTGASGAGVLDAQRAGAQAHRDGQGLSSGSLGAGAAGAGVGAGALGAGAAGASRKDASTSAPQADNERGAPVVDPKELDNGGRHGLIYDKSTGKYVHRHEVEEGK